MFFWLDATYLGVVIVPAAFLAFATHGHRAGDMVLEALGELLQSRTRGGDVACRFGGEEFVLVFPGAALEDALARAENLYKREGFERLHRTRWVKKIM